jgi:hypothetical protein
MSERTFAGAAGSSDGEMEVVANVPSVCPANGDRTGAESGERSDGQDPFAGNAVDVAADETRRKVELFTWADSVLGLSGAELELALDDAVKRFEMSRASLKRIIAARRAEQAKQKAKRNRAGPNDDKDNVKYYSQNFKVSDRGVFARKVDDNGHPFWDKICTTRIDLEALTRDAREENWGITSRSPTATRGRKSAQSLTPLSMPTKLRTSPACWLRSASASFDHARLASFSCSSSRSI